MPISKGGVSPCHWLRSGWITLKRIPSVSHRIVSGRCSIRGSGHPNQNWGLKNRSRYLSAKQRKGRARKRGRDRSLKTFPIRGIISKLHSYIRRWWAYIWSGWGNVPPSTPEKGSETFHNMLMQVSSIQNPNELVARAYKSLLCESIIDRDIGA